MWMVGYFAWITITITGYLTAPIAWLVVAVGTETAEITVTNAVTITLGEVTSVVTTVIVTVILVVTILVTSVTPVTVTTLEVLIVTLVPVGTTTASILVANVSITTTVSVVTMWTVTLVRAVTIRIVVTGVIVTVTVTIIGGMECGPEMKVNKKDPILLIKIQATTMLDFQALLAIKDQVLMLLFLHE